MIVRTSSWNMIRTQFTEAEKESLNKAVIGHAICPRGLIIDEVKLEQALRSKLKAAVKKSLKAGA